MNRHRGEVAERTLLVAVVALVVSVGLGEVAAGASAAGAQLVGFEAVRGKREWTANLGLPVVWTAPSASNGHVSVIGMPSCFSSGATLIGLDTRDGHASWRTPLKFDQDLGAPAGPFAGAGVVVVILHTHQGDRLEGFDASTGHRRWQQTVSSDHSYAEVGSLIVVQPANAQSADQNVMAYDKVTGRLRWQVTLLPDPSRGLLATPSTLYLFTTTLPVADRQSMVTAINPPSGQQRWQVSFAGNALSPSATAGMVVTVQSQVPAPDTLVALDAGTGRELWRHPDAPLPLGDVSAGDGNLYIVSASEVTALDRRTGGTRWAIQESGDQGGPVAGNGVVALQQSDRVSVVRARDGARLWRASASASTYAQKPDTLAGGSLVVLRRTEACGGD